MSGHMTSVDSEVPPTLDVACHALSERHFKLFQALIRKEAGIHISEGRKSLLVSRLGRRLRALGLRSYEEYYSRVGHGDGVELIHLLDAVCTNETHFVRELHQFEYLERHVFETWKRKEAAGLMPRRIRAWSAGCSTGEEPYSLAMVLLKGFPPGSGWSLDVLATDLSSRVLEHAEKGVWPIEKEREISPEHKKLFMLKGRRSQEGRIAAGREIRSIVRFKRLNLIDDAYDIGMFDIILCRNVLIYFASELKKKVIGNLLGHLSPSGLLLVGHAESLTSVTERVRSVGPMVYAFRPETGASRRVSGSHDDRPGRQGPDSRRDSANQE